MKRKKPAKNIETIILTRSRRWCCLCFGLAEKEGPNDGQIAHLDHKPNNNAEDNLAWLCLSHHDKYDSKTSQSKGLTKQEVKVHRAKLYDYLNKIQTGKVGRSGKLGVFVINAPCVSFIIDISRIQRKGESIAHYKLEANLINTNNKAGGLILRVNNDWEERNYSYIEAKHMQGDTGRFITYGFISFSEVTLDATIYGQSKKTIFMFKVFCLESSCPIVEKIIVYNKPISEIRLIGVSCVGEESDIGAGSKFVLKSLD